MRKRTTLKQLARELNLSISTVSKSLNNDSEISKKTINRVHELAKFYNYRPNALAVSLKNNKTNTIAVILPEILNHFFAKVLYGIEQEATDKGYKIVTCISNESYKKEVEYVEMLNYSSVDGFILALSHETQILNKVEHIKELKRDEIPVVLFDRVSDEIDCDKVVVDDKQASKKAIEYLISTGCKTIAVISTIFDLSVGRLRIEGAQEAVKSNKEVTLIELPIKNLETEEKEIESFLKNNVIDAILGLDEPAAAIATNMSHKLGYKIPEEISIISFADGLLSQHSYPKLSSVCQHAESLGAKATKMLLNRIDNSSNANYMPRTEVVKTSLILRGSTR